MLINGSKNTIFMWNRFCSLLTIFLAYSLFSPHFIKLLLITQIIAEILKTQLKWLSWESIWIFYEDLVLIIIANFVKFLRTENNVSTNFKFCPMFVFCLTTCNDFSSLECRQISIYLWQKTFYTCFQQKKYDTHWPQKHWFETRRYQSSWFDDVSSKHQNTCYMKIQFQNPMKFAIFKSSSPKTLIQHLLKK